MAANPPVLPPPPPADPAQQRLKEGITALIALIVVIGTALLAFVAVRNIGDKETFVRAKDLLLFVNPILGYVIGYYFNKTITDKSIDRADAKSGTLKTTLRNVIDAGRQVLGQRGPQSKVLGAAAPGLAPPAPEAIRFEAMLDQAESVMHL